MKNLLPALSSEALLAKSRLYIRKALTRKEQNDFEEYQLWASLALELLGKSVLASIHPSLIADPNHYQSLFAASGINLSTDLKTIAAHTLFERLKHLSKSFDEKAKLFCTGIAQRRNAELHSGESPFKTVRAEAWEAQYWHATDIILRMMNLSLDEWLGGAELAAAPKALLDHVREARRASARIRIERAKESFEALSKGDRERALTDAERMRERELTPLFDINADEIWTVPCPACGGCAGVAGYQAGEEVIDTVTDEYAVWESVAQHFVAEELRCPACSLALNGEEELIEADIDIEYTKEEERQMEHEPDYGND